MAVSVANTEDEQIVGDSVRVVSANPMWDHELPSTTLALSLPTDSVQMRGSFDSVIAEYALERVCYAP